MHVCAHVWATLHVGAHVCNAPARLPASRLPGRLLCRPQKRVRRRLEDEAPPRPSPPPTPQDAVYPLLITDAAGKPAVSPGKYTITFKKGEAPPVGAFWSVTM
jgi:hypothetical protein